MHMQRLWTRYRNCTRTSFLLKTLPTQAAPHLRMHRRHSYANLKTSSLCARVRLPVAAPEDNQPEGRKTPCAVHPYLNMELYIILLFLPLLSVVYDNKKQQSEETSSSPCVEDGIWANGEQKPSLNDMLLRDRSNLRAVMVLSTRWVNFFLRIFESFKFFRVGKQTVFFCCDSEPAILGKI